MIFWIAAILTALGTTFAIILGLSTEVSIITSAVVAIVYTMVGGLRKLIAAALQLREVAVVALCL